jgi:hypothetical protein
MTDSPIPPTRPETRIDLDAAASFLRALDPAAEQFTFQTFTDPKPQPRPDPLARTRHGSLATAAPYLTQLSGNGAGVFVTINETDGTRNAAHIVRVRARFADLDGAPLANIKRLGLVPHIVVASSSGRFQVYWRVKGASLDNFKRPQQLLAKLVGGDAKVCDLPRVMRLPGFPHQKDPNNPFAVILSSRDHAAYEDAEFQAALAAAEARYSAEVAGDPPAAPSLVRAAMVPSGPPSMTEGFPDGQRTQELLRRAGWYLGPLNKTEAETAAACLDWNQHNTPPLPEEKVRATVASIAKAEAKKRVNESSLSNDIADGVAADEGNKPDAHDWRENVVSATALRQMTFEPMRFVLLSLLVIGVTLLVGRPKIGKSWLALAIALACAGCGTALGLPAEQGDVLYLALEDSRRRLRGRLDKLLSSVQTDWPERLKFVSIGDWRRQDMGGLADLAAWCRSVAKPTLIVIDTLARFRKPATGKTPLYNSDYEAIADMQKIAIEHGVAIVVLHHTRKAGADSPFDTVSGTLGLTGGADATLVMERKNTSVVLHAQGRDIEESETAIQFDKATCRWTVLGPAAEVHRSQERTRVIDAFKWARQGSLSTTEIMVHAEIKNRNAADILLSRMVRDGEIRRVGTGRYALFCSTSDPGKIGQKERSNSQDTDLTGETADLSDLSDLFSVDDGERNEPPIGKAKQ